VICRRRLEEFDLAGMFRGIKVKFGILTVDIETGVDLLDE